MPNANYANVVKQGFRWTSIIEPWLKLTKLHQIPAGRQYVTLCGPMTEQNLQVGAAYGGCELRYLLDPDLEHGRKLPFLTPSQFHGIEWDATIHAQNVAAVEKLFPDPANRPVLDCKDIVMYLNNHPELWPAIVNLDFKGSPKRHMRALIRILNLLNLRPGPTMVVWNVAVASFHLGYKNSPGVRKGTWKEFEKLRRPDLITALRDGGWMVLALKDPEYKGSRTWMQSLVLGKPQ